MNSIAQKDLDRIVQSINQLLPEAKIYLFGSYATGKQKADRDIDLCVVAPEYTGRRMEVLYSLRVALRNTTEIPIDILAFTDEEFKRKSMMKPTIQYTIANEGVLLNGQ